MNQLIFHIDVLLIELNVFTNDRHVFLPVYVAGQQHEPLKHDPPFKQPDDTGHSESNIGGSSFSVHIFGGPQPFKQSFSPFELQ